MLRQMKPVERASYPHDLRLLEKDMIEARRRAIGKPNGYTPWIALALSGGGVRSATFNLGVLQVLARNGILRDIDVMSTVSGGGYIGGFLGRLHTRFMNRPKGAADVVEQKVADSQSPDIAWLRHSGEYLSPAGKGDVFVNAAVIIRNFLTVHLILWTFVGASFGITNGMRYAGQRYREQLVAEDPVWQVVLAPYENLWPYASVWFAAVAVLGACWVLPLAIAYWLPSEKKVAAFQPATTGAMLLSAGAAMFYGLGTQRPVASVAACLVCAGALAHLEFAWRRIRLRMPGGTVNLNVRATRNLLSARLAQALAVTAGLVVIGFIDIAGEWTFKAVYPAVGRVSIVVAIAIGLVALYLPLRQLALWISAVMPAGDDGDPRSWPLFVFNRLAVPVMVAGPPLIAIATLSHATYRAGSDLRTGLVATGVALATSIILGRAIALVNNSSLQKMYAARTIRAYLGASNADRHTGEEGADITTTQPDDDVSWRKYRPDLTGGPLHLVNVFVNESIDRASQRTIRDRQGENMAIGPCGISVGLGYHGLWVADTGFGSIKGLRPHQSAELPHPLTPRSRVPSVARAATGRPLVAVEELSLGEWLAISGAAVSPGRGNETSLGTSLLLGIANLRVGHWWDSHIEDGQREGETILSVRGAVWRLVKRLFRTQGLLLSELTGQFAGPWRRYWYLSDAGNFDNLGVYELLRRRVPLIICVDASRDARGTLEGLANLVRKARIDFDADIQFLTTDQIAEVPDEQRDRSGKVFVSGLPAEVRRNLGALDDFRLNQHGLSNKHAAVARIFFESANVPESVLLYIKSSITGDETPDVLEYDARKPDFPHESTRDQSFDEAQWESYRKLGEHCASPLFGSAGLDWLCCLLGPFARQPAEPRAEPCVLSVSDSQLTGGDSGIFSPLTINGVTFGNRILRSSLGGRMANYDGTVTDVWKNFEKLFADGGVSGIISTTFNVNPNRHSPLEYPPLSHDRYIGPLQKCIREIRDTGCKYIIQLGDPGYVTQTSLFSEEQDTRSSSAGFDFFYGYGNTRTMMSETEIERAIGDFIDAAERVVKIGADGIEITAAKGYLIHQFLNPGLNRRRDKWGSGGPEPKRFLLLRRIIEGIRDRIGRHLLLGVKMSARDDNYLPLQNIRLPIVWNLKHHFIGNTEAETLVFAKELEQLGVDYLHVVAGCGFVSPLDTPGPLPLTEGKIFFSSVSHLSLKSRIRAGLINVTPNWLANIGWQAQPKPGAETVGWPPAGRNLVYSERFKQHVGMAIITNGGFKNKDLIEGALRDRKTDMVSIGRGLLAQPDLVCQFSKGIVEPENGCTYCNKCAGRAATSPLGCYDTSRFDGDVERMQASIMAMNRPDR
jgi:2,4-dienoyl-CoA reductase-like NADH-dependent reductase (Old Yellow Enzyme family)